MSFSICNDFSIIKERALKEPETSEELMDMIAFVGNARTAGMIKLNEQIKVSLMQSLKTFSVRPMLLD